MQVTEQRMLIRSPMIHAWLPTPDIYVHSNGQTDPLISWPEAYLLFAPPFRPRDVALWSSHASLMKGPSGEHSATL